MAVSSRTIPMALPPASASTLARMSGSLSVVLIRFQRTRLHMYGFSMMKLLVVGPPRSDDADTPPVTALQPAFRDRTSDVAAWSAASDARESRMGLGRRLQSKD